MTGGTKRLEPLVVMLPAYNEERSLPALLERYAALGLDLRMIVVDDGSTDRTVERIEPFRHALDIEVVRHPANRGLGRAMYTGIKRAAEIAGAGGLIVSMDADNSHLPAHIPGMIRQIEAGADVSIASRYRRGSKVVGVPLHRLVLSWGTLAAMKLLVPVRGVRDYSCGYRVYSGALIRRAIDAYGDGFITVDGFQVQLEILLKLSRLGARFTEYPMELRYDQKLSASKIRIARTIRNYVRLIADVRRLPPVYDRRPDA